MNLFEKIRGTITGFLFIFILSHNCSAQSFSHGKVPVRKSESLNKNWKFHLGNASDPTKDFDYGLVRNFTIANGSGGAIKRDFKDSTWRTVNIPHDWAVELPFEYANNFDVQSHGYRPVGGLYPQNNIGWYRKKFLVNRADSGQRMVIHMEGIYRDFKVWINNNYIGSGFSGYIENAFDVTDYIDYTKPNVLVIRVDATQYEGWFYEGAGIYRNITLEQYSEVNIPQNGVYVSSEIRDGNAIVRAETSVRNQRMDALVCTVESYIVDREGKRVNVSVSNNLTVNPNDTAKVIQHITLNNPRLWDLDNPYLYHLISIVKNKGKVIDSTSTVLGIRTIKFDAEKGFFLNNKSIKIKGICNHQDHAGVGVAVPDALVYYRIKLLKEMGANAYRCSHNPPSKAVLNACDELGMLVMDENRLMGTGAEYLQQFESLILRDRNHPSIILWSLGNEETGIQNTELGRRLAQTLVNRQRALDPSRGSTYGGNNGNRFFGINQEVDVRGFNYHIGEIAAYHDQHPRQPILFTEVSSMVSSRGMYKRDSISGYLPDYDLNKPNWGQTAEEWWKFTADKPWLMGGFVWTGFDYRGEPTPFSWPNVNSHFGIMDVCGFPKNTYYYYQSWWGDKDVIKTYPHWNNHKLGDTIKVWCNSNAESVELMLNGKSLGQKAMPVNGHLEWNVAYTPGKLEAIGKKNGRTIRYMNQTSDNAYRIVLTPDRKIINADGEDLSVVNVFVVDKKGIEVPDAMNNIKFSLVGNGSILGVGNGDPSSHEPDRYLNGGWQRKLFNGKCQIIIQASETEGVIKLAATAEGVKNSVLELKTIK